MVIYYWLPAAEKNGIHQKPCTYINCIVSIDADEYIEGVPKYFSLVRKFVSLYIKKSHFKSKRSSFTRHYFGIQGGTKM